ncbi:MAG: Rho-binding antiterminator [Bacteroidota bacterium]
MTSSYTPIDCNYYDLLEIAAMRHKVVAVEYLPHEEPTPKVIEARIEDLWARNGEEFMRLSTGQVIRLDQLISMDGHPRPDAASSCRV